MKLKIEILLILLLFGCSDPFVNQRTSIIYDLNTECVSDSAWIKLKTTHTIDHITNPKLKDALQEFKMMPFGHEIYYFTQPEELIAVSSEHNCVRYVYNFTLSKQVLNGLSPQLSKQEKERVGTRIQSILRNYQCESERSHRYVQEWDNDPDKATKSPRNPIAKFFKQLLSNSD